MSKTLILGAHVYDPPRGVIGVRHVVIEGATIAEVRADADPPAVREGDDVVDAKGCVLSPGFIDLRAHAREPGDEQDEDLNSLSRTAVAGGFTTVVVTPDTSPCNDDCAVTELILRRSAEIGLCRILPMGALTHRMQGEHLAPIGEMADAGAVCVGDGDQAVRSSRLMRSAMEYASGFNLPVFVHAVDPDLAQGGQMHEGAWSTRLGLRGVPAEAEEAFIGREIALASLTRARLHIAHVSSARGVALIREAKDRGLPVTAETTIWHLALTDQALADYPVNLKLVPPIRGAEDREALRAALLDGTIDAVCSDHTPDNVADKAVEFDAAAPGAIALQTCAGQLFELVRKKLFRPENVLGALTTGPSVALGRPEPRLQVGAAADLVLFDPEREWTLDATTNLSKSRNTVLFGRPVRGLARRTWYGGRLVWGDPQRKR